MSAHPLPAHDLEADAERIFNAQQAVKSLCEARDNLTAEIAAQYRTIEDAGYALRLHLSEIQKNAARIGKYEIACKYDDKRHLSGARKVSSLWTGEVRILPGAPTTRIVVREAKS